MHYTNVKEGIKFKEIDLRKTAYRKEGAVLNQITVV